MSIVLYTPIYRASPGTQFRVNLVQKSLEITGHKTTLITGRETQLHKIYHSLGDKLLTKESVWKIIGKLISKPIIKQKPKTAILFIDVCASAIPYLKKHNVNTILSIEDLTPEYKNYNPKTAEKFYQILTKHAEQANVIITPSYTLSERLEHLGLKAIPVPIGLEPYITPEEALARPSPPTILHAGQLNTKKQMEILLNLADKYKLLIHNFGRLADKLKHPNIEKYRKLTPKEAINTVKRAHLGLILEYRKAYTLSRLYFHTSLLQPIIAEGEGDWIREAHLLGMKLHSLKAITKIVENYEQHIRDCTQVQKKLSIPYIHRSLLNLL